ncbi:hypothetical protein DLR41_20360 [Salmonella enterica subsp. enterica serovar Panama]|nr:hypothetical protein [Salmonella enterica subsp. enterica serovar Panama]
MVTYPRHSSRCKYVGDARSHQSLTHVSSWWFSLLPLVCNSNYLGYILWAFQDKGRWQVHAHLYLERR